MTLGSEPPTSEYPRGPHIIDQRRRDILTQLRFVLDTLRAQGGTATFVAYGKQGEKRLRHLRDKLPLTYGGIITKGDPNSPLASARDKYLRYQCTLFVRPASEVPDVTLTGDPQADIAAEHGERLEAEKARLREKHPGWRSSGDPPTGQPPA